MSATDPLAGEGTTCAGRGSSLETASASDGRGAFSKARFSMIALAVFARGGHWRDVARAAGIAPNLARAYGARLLIKSPHPRGRPALVQAIRDCAARGMSRNAAAEALGISYDSIKGFARHYGIDFIRGKTGPKCGRSAAQRNRNRADTGGTPRK